MSYGTIKVDTITFTDGGVDKSVSVSGLTQNPTITGNLTVTGTATAAALIPSGSSVPTNGVYLPSANNVAISTGGTGRLFVNSTGQVGIGDTPTARLDVRGLVKIGNYPGVSSSTFQGLVIQNGIDSSSTESLSIIDSQNNLGTTDASIFLQHGTDGGSYVSLSTTPAGSRSTDRRQERLRITSDGKLLVGTSSAITTTNALTAKLQSAGNNVFDTGISTSLFTADTNPAVLQLVKSRNATTGSHTVVQSGDGLGRIAFGGSDGADFKPAAWIEGRVDGTPGANTMPGILVFSTTSTTPGASPTERMRIKNNGIINFSNVPTYADNTAATTGGLVVGDVYRTSTGQLMIRY
jgi:hypothetical protein